MKLFRSKKEESPSTRRATDSKKGIKVSNYYTPATRSNTIPKIDSSKRGGPKKKQHARGYSSTLAKRIAVIALGAFFLYNILYLRHNPIVVMDRETSVGRLSVYEPAIDALLSSSVLNANKLTLRAADIEKQIIEEFPEIEQAVVSASLVGKRPVVHLYQQDIPFTIESKGKTYAITQNGVVAGEAATFTGTNKTTPIKDESGVEVKKGARVLRSDDAEFFVTVSAIMGKQGRAVERVRLTSVPREAYIKLADLTYELRVFLDEPADEQMGTFIAAENTLKGRGEVPTTYMDLRAGEKVFWQ